MYDSSISVGNKLATLHLDDGSAVEVSAGQISDASGGSVIHWKVSSGLHVFFVRLAPSSERRRTRLMRLACIWAVFCAKLASLVLHQVLPIAVLDGVRPDSLQGALGVGSRRGEARQPGQYAAEPSHLQRSSAKGV